MDNKRIWGGRQRERATYLIYKNPDWPGLETPWDAFVLLADAMISLPRAGSKVMAKIMEAATKIIG
jgi:hypothetical protein